MGNEFGIEGLDFTMPEATYHSDPCPEPSVSSSIVKIADQQTMKHVWEAHPRLNPNYETEDKKTFDLGKSAHSLMLRDPRHFVLVEADDWRTKDAKEQRAQAYKEHKTPLLAHQYPEVEKMVAAGREQIKNLEDCSNAFVGGKAEVTIMWPEQIDLGNGVIVPVWCRIRIDHCAENEIDFYDYKTTGESADPRTLPRYGANLGWHITTAFYKRGIRKVLGLTNIRYKYIVQENYAPFCLSPLEMSQAAEERGNLIVERTLRKWAWCMHNKVWPGYTTKTVTLDLPKYVEMAMEENAIMEDSAAQDGRDLMKEANNWKVEEAEAA